MNEIYQLQRGEQELIFRAAADALNIPFEIIEKDYWVVWILERVFSLDELKSKLTFKGGTSLSKVFRVIHRFSEDIDLSIEREFFGFGPPKDPEGASSRKKQNKILENLSQSCSHYVQTKVLDSLSDAIATKLGTKEGWEIFPDPHDNSCQTLLFEYPSRVSKSGYIRPFVKIEIGARSEHWPVGEYLIQSYAKEALKEKINEASVQVRVLSAARTFWEKATILHQYSHLPEDKNLPPRLSRHFYDFFCLLGSEIKDDAIDAIDLLTSVAKHKNLYFYSPWANYQTASQGTLRLIPPQKILKELEKDYHLMKPMFFRETPEWGSVVETVGEFEKSFNARKD